MSNYSKVNDFQFGTHIHLEKYQFTNGLTLIVFPDHTAPVFSYHTWFNVGSRNERDGITGMAHLFEHLMFKETKNYAAGQFDRLCEEAGGKINAATYLDWTFYRQSLPVEAFAMMAELEADRMQNMILSQEQLDSEREVVANERLMRVDNNPTGTLYEALYKNAFTKHPYHWPVIGWMKDIQSMSLKQCMRFYENYYAPNNAVIVLVGDLTVEQALKEIDLRYGHIPASDVKPLKVETEPEQTAEISHTIEQEISSPRLMMGYKVPQATHEDIPKLELLHALLFDGRSSRLYRKLVHETKLATSASGWVNHTKSPGLYIIDVTAKPNVDPQEIIALIDQEMKILQTELAPLDELEKCKTRTETSFWGQLSTTDDKAQSIGFHEIVYQDYRLMFDEIQEIQKLSPEDIQYAAKIYLHPNKRTVVIGQPKKT
jgi:zinc protease